MARSEEEGHLEAPEVRSLLADLRTGGSRFHGWAEDIEVDWGLNEVALDLLVDLVHHGDRTLETGVGYSTVVFAARGATHTVVSPFTFEHERVASWCAEHGIDVTTVTFIAKPSQELLPSLDPDPLDLVLIDGDHAFPTPFLDFYYTAGRLEPGGLLVLDDTHVRSCAVLDEFLRADTPRWRLHTELWTTTVFQRLDGPLAPPEGWSAQPWSEETLRADGPLTLQQRLRSTVRLRTRLRGRRGIGSR